MQFLWNWALASLVLIPLFVVAYVRAQHRRATFALRYPSLTILRDSTAGQSKYRRHIPALVFLLAISSMFIAAARPYALISALQPGKTVILTIDISASMLRSDVKPSRLEAAKAAAHEFVAHQDPSVRIGVVAFSDGAAVVQPPTERRDQVLAAVDRLHVDASTAIGSGILTSLSAIEQANWTVPSMPAATASTEPDAPVPAVIVLLTDGRNIVGPSPVEAAKEASQLGVRIFTVGVGAASSQALAPTPTDELDESLLMQIADTTHAQYYRALDEQALANIYRNLDVHLSQTTEPMEITPEFTALGLVLLLIGGALSFHWFGGLP